MRLGLRLLAVVSVLVLVLVVGATLLMQQRLAAAGIDQLEWDALGWSAGALTIERLSGRYTDVEGARLDIDARKLRLDPVWSGGPRLEVLRVEELDLEWQPVAGPPGNRAVGIPDVQQLAGSLAWLPFQLLALPEIRIGLPCGSRRCELSGGLAIEREDSQRYALQLALLAEEGSIELAGYLRSDTTGLEADLNLRLSGQEAAALQAQWLYGESAPRSQGVLTVPGWPQADWLLVYLQPWMRDAQLPVDSLPTGLSADLRWLLAPVDRPQTFADMLAGAVELRAEMTLAQPWHIPDVGAAEGEMTLDLLGDQGLWQLRQGRAAMRLSEPTLPALVALPTQVCPQVIALDVRARDGSELAWTNSLPLIVEAQVVGPVTASLRGPLEVMSRPQWQAKWEEMHLLVDTERYDLNALQLRQLKLDWQSGGRVDAQQLSIGLGPKATLSAGSVQAPQMVTLRNVRADLSGLTLQIPLDRPAATEASGALTISAGRLEHALLLPQSWTLQGTMTRDATGLHWQGGVAAASELALDLRFAWPAGERWRADIELEPTFLRAGDALSATLRSWPELLSLRSGLLQGEVSLRGAQGLDSADGRLEIESAAGIYDRMTFEGLSAVVDIGLSGDTLQFDMPALSLDSLDPGVPMGPLNAQAHYAADLDRPIAGRLNIEQAHIGVLGGQVLLDPAVLDLSADRHELVVDIRGVELDRLFEAYPAEGLRGRGTLDGRLPLTLADSELTIDEGKLAARAPGGFLQYRSQKLESLAESTPGMRQVAQALDDFQYDLLSADVTYREGGILVLGLELQGRNPTVEGGRPIHLNIRLEEDIPALLASLQLSGQVSDVIQERIQQRLLQQRAGP